MALPLQSFLGSLKYNLLSNRVVLQSTVRFASKKASGANRNKQEKTTPKRRGPKKYVGDYVEKGMILYKQLGLKYYPGENVGCGRDLTLFALEAGRIVMSREKLSPYPSSPLYDYINNGKTIYKLFYNVIPDPQPKIFKLVSRT
ncbi:hypothetical protein LSH36_249g01090 [Paralvinella palmiformis]|uniref:Large ribosomal subunit protein bL27m n=1 Tax=Paralvinella palmiformis TaxID=53620 RepID=A0AAD9N4V6_9ANNE|nr:hypothetical protein LSH36_249g01090 [Paralvinella palmiformis]